MAFSGTKNQKKTHALTLEQLINSLKQVKSSADFEKSGLSSTFIIYGDESLRIRRLVHWIKEQLLGQNTSSFTSYFGSELSSKSNSENIIQSLTNLSLFSQTEIICIYDADKVKAAIAKPIVEAAEKSNSSTLLILCSSALNQKATLLTGLQKTATLVEVSRLQENQLKRWIEKEVLRAGAKGISPDAVQVLIKSYATDLSTLAQQINKLSLLAKEDEIISKNLVLELSLKTPERKSFDLVTHIARKNLSATAELLKDLLNQGLHPLQLTAFLSRAFRTLLAHKKISPEQKKTLSGTLNNPWFLRNLSSAQNSFSEKELINSIEALKAVDFKLKSANLSDNLELAIAIERLASR